MGPTAATHIDHMTHLRSRKPLHPRFTNASSLSPLSLGYGAEQMDFVLPQQPNDSGERPSIASSAQGFGQGSNLLVLLGKLRADVDYVQAHDANTEDLHFAFRFVCMRDR